MSARFAPRLALIAVVALAARLIYALVIVKTDVLIGDAREFDTLARNLADGHGYVNPYLLEQGTVRPTAFKPPGYPFALAGVTALGGGGYVAHHVFTCLLGVVTVVLVGLIGRRVGGDRVGLAAAGIAALYPILIAADGSLRSEALYTMLVAACMWAALRLVDRPTTVRALVLGAFVGLAALTRTEALILLVLLAVPVVGRSPARLRQVAVALAAAVLVIAPWTIRNWSAFDQPVLVSTNDGGVFRGANCDQAYHGPGTGFWFIECIGPTGERNEAKSSAVQRRQGLEYAREQRAGPSWSAVCASCAHGSSTSPGARPGWAASSRAGRCVSSSWPRSCTSCWRRWRWRVRCCCATAIASWRCSWLRSCWSRCPAPSPTASRDSGPAPSRRSWCWLRWRSWPPFSGWRSAAAPARRSSRAGARGGTRAPGSGRPRGCRSEAAQVVLAAGGDRVGPADHGARAPGAQAPDDVALGARAREQRDVTVQDVGPVGQHVQQGVAETHEVAAPGGHVDRVAGRHAPLDLGDHGRKRVGVDGRAEMPGVTSRSSAWAGRGLKVAERRLATP